MCAIAVGQIPRWPGHAGRGSDLRAAGSILCGDGELDKGIGEQPAGVGGGLTQGILPVSKVLTPPVE